VTYYRKSQQLPTLIFFCALFAVFAAASIIAQRVFVKGENLGLSFVPAAAALFFLLGTGVILDADEFTLIAQIAALALLFASWRWCRGRLRATYFTLGIIIRGEYSSLGKRSLDHFRNMARLWSLADAFRLREKALVCAVVSAPVHWDHCFKGLLC
jgi:hypothetical protein